MKLSKYNFPGFSLILAGLFLVLLLPVAQSQPGEGHTKELRVAVYFHKDKAYYTKIVREIAALLTEDKGFLVTKVRGADIKNGWLRDFQVLIMPGGSGSAQAEALGEEGCAEITKFVKNGGGFIGIGAGAYLASSDYSWSLNLINAKVLDRKHWNRGTGQVKLALTPDGKELLGHTKSEVEMRYAHGPLYAPANTSGLGAYDELATFVTEVTKEGVPGGVMPGRTAIARASFAKGRVITFGVYPETPGGPGHFLINAVRWVARVAD